jgi:MIP family channel proteins
VRAHAAEALGTFALVVFGCGAIAVDARGHGLGQLGIALAFGLVVAVMVYAIGHISGAHLNPAVSVAFAVGGRMPWLRAASYAAAQIAGAITAALVLTLTLGSDADIGATAPTIPVLPALAWEAGATFVLVLVICAVATDARAPRDTAAIAIGAAVALGATVAGPLTGGSMNPARSIGPALISGHTGDLWLYVAGPVIGAISASMAYRLLR